ncbi:MAG: acyl-CoA thioesterase [Candidatus Omnitrophica bacterium]|nr:acyl-CoA thioesterase [Candidatus Omnitrophota bacterium]
MVRKLSDYNSTLHLEVRDYECDLQGIVNNAVYQHYLEHARHQLLKQFGLNFAELSQKGINLVIVKALLEYKHPLRSNDSFVVGTNMVRCSDVRFDFLQDVFRLSDQRLILTSTFTCAAMNAQGRPTKLDVLEDFFNRVARRSPT